MNIENIQVNTQMIQSKLKLKRIYYTFNQNNSIVYLFASINLSSL